MQRCVPRVYTLDTGSMAHNEEMLEVRLNCHLVWFRFEGLGIEPTGCAYEAPPLSYASSPNWALIGSVWVMKYTHRSVFITRLSILSLELGATMLHHENLSSKVLTLILSLQH